MRNLIRVISVYAPVVECPVFSLFYFSPTLSFFTSLASVNTGIGAHTDSSDNLNRVANVITGTQALARQS